MYSRIRNRWGGGGGVGGGSGRVLRDHMAYRETRGGGNQSSLTEYKVRDQRKLTNSMRGIIKIPQNLRGRSGKLYCDTTIPPPPSGDSSFWVRTTSNNIINRIRCRNCQLTFI